MSSSKLAHEFVCNKFSSLGVLDGGGPNRAAGSNWVSITCQNFPTSLLMSWLLHLYVVVKMCTCVRQMGRGRTTTGMVIACLVLLRCENGTPLRMPGFPTATLDTDSGSSSGEDGNSDMQVGSPANRLEDQNCIAGFVMDDIPIVRKITRLLENGAECREALDGVIDHCAAMQNLRQAVLHYRRAFNQQNLEHHARHATLNRGVEYLERYLMLIAFAAYLGSDSFDGHLEHCWAANLLFSDVDAWFRSNLEAGFYDDMLSTFGLKS